MKIKTLLTFQILASVALSGCSSPSTFPDATYTIIPGVVPSRVASLAAPVTPHLKQYGEPETILIQMPEQTYRTAGAWLRWFWPDDWYIEWNVSDADALRSTPVSVTAHILKSEHIITITDRWLSSLHLRGEIDWTNKTLKIFPLT